MIFINRDSFPPYDPYLSGEHLGRQKWKVAEKQVIDDFRSNSSLFSNGKYDFKAHPSYNIWKKEILKYQGNKCCYCEKSIGSGQLDHFRPKKGWKQKRGDKISKPGYYWLAFRWRNLVLSCAECNSSSAKGNLFPISGKRAVSFLDQLDNENKMLINPYFERPEVHLEFVKDEPHQLSTTGKETIESFDLRNRADIKEDRKTKFEHYSLALIVANENPATSKFNADHIKEAQKLIRRVQKGKEPFAGMILSNIRAGRLII